MTVTLRDECGADVATWVLRNVVPLEYSNPTLAAKAGDDIAIEELVLSVEGFDLKISKKAEETSLPHCI